MKNEDILKQLVPQVGIKWIKLPEKVFLNDFYQNHSSNELEALIKPPNKRVLEKDFQGTIQTIHEGKLLFEKQDFKYYILGTVPRDFAYMGVTLMIEDKYSFQKERVKIDLYEKEEVFRLVMSLSDVFNHSESKFEADIHELIDALENFRESRIIQKKSKPQKTIKSEDLEKAKMLLKSNELIPKLNMLIG